MTLPRTPLNEIPLPILSSTNVSTRSKTWGLHHILNFYTMVKLRMVLRLQQINFMDDGFSAEKNGASEFFFFFLI